MGDSNKNLLFNGWLSKATKEARNSELGKLIPKYTGDKKARLSQSVDRLNSLDELYKLTYGNRGEMTNVPASQRAGMFQNQYGKATGESIEVPELDSLSKYGKLERKRAAVGEASPELTARTERQFDTRIQSLKEQRETAKLAREQATSFNFEKEIQNVTKGGSVKFEENMGRLFRKAQENNIPASLLGDKQKFAEKMRLYTILEEAGNAGALRSAVNQPNLPEGTNLPSGFQFPAIKRKVEAGLPVYETLEQVQRGLSTHAEPAKLGSSDLNALGGERAANYVARVARNNAQPIGSGTAMSAKVGESAMPSMYSDETIGLAVEKLKENGKYDTARAAIELLKAGSKDGTIREVYANNLIKRYADHGKEIAILLEDALNKGGYRLVP
jgi:hypothetical protein